MTVPTVPLGDLARVVSGGTPKRSEPAFFDGDIPWVKIGDMLQGTIAHTEESITDAGLTGSSAKLLPAGTLLLSIFATIGRTAVLGIDAATNQAIAGLLIKDSSYVDGNYLRRYLEFASEGLANQGRGVAQANINLSILRSHPVPVPQMEEQIRIARMLDAADALRAKRCLAITRLDSLAQTIFIDMFGDPARDSRWPTASLGQICKSKGEYGANVPSRAFDSSRFPRYLRITDIREDGTLIEKAVAPGGSENEWRSKSLYPGDICFARSGSVGKAFLMREEYAPLIFAGYLIRFVPDPTKVHPEYLFAYVQTRHYWAWVSRAATTVAQPNINASKYAQLELPLPPLDMQRQFADAVERIRHRAGSLRTSARCMDTLFSSLQQQAFRGDL